MALNQAIDAAEAVEIDYEELPFVIHAEDALKPGAPARAAAGAWCGRLDATLAKDIESTRKY